MSVLKIESGFFAAGPSQIENTCWLAREILGAYMDAGTALDLGDDASLLRRLDEDGEDVDITIHETPQLAISKIQRACLTNLPYIANDLGKLVPLTDPGFVALRAEPVNSPSIDDQLQLDERCAQIIFRQPNPSRIEEAAIFIGFSVDEKAAVPEDDIAKIKNLEFILRCMRTGYRLIMQDDTETFELSYLSQVPLAPATSDDLLQELFGGE